MKKKLDWLNKGMRPAAAMLICTCIAFSAVMPYKPPAVSADAEFSSSEAETAEEEIKTADSVEETAETTETIMERDLTAPTPYRLNFAYMYEEGGEESYAEILMKELVSKDSQWYAGIYDMANMAPLKLATRIGKSREQTLGQYNPASTSQDPNDPSTWNVEHFKNVRISFYDGDGNITSAVSNAQQILSMASVYCYYNGIEDLDGIRTYVNKLWSSSHSYSASMGDVYFCSGCVDPSVQPTEGDEDAELEGEDTFNGESTINTEITVKETDDSTAQTDENGETITDSKEDQESLSGFDTLNGSEESGKEGSSTSSLPTEKTTPEFSGTTVAVETTTSPIDSLAATAESVYIEETTSKVTIIRPGESKSESKSKEETPTKPTMTESATQSSKTETSKAEEETPAPAPTTAAPAESEKEETPQAAETPSESRNVIIVRPEEGTESTSKAVPGADLAFLPEGADTGLPEAEYKMYAASVSSSSADTEGSQQALICPGHIDLKITAKVQSLDESEGLFQIDQVGNAVEEEGQWSGWNDRTKAFVNHINRQDWTESYGISVTVEGTKAPLSSTEIESYMKLLPENTSEERKEIIRFALQSVGKVPYYWGGKASARNYSGNNFGSITIPDHRGRILKGLDCSGWINWVYWSVTGNHLPYEGTEGLKTIGRQVAREDLKPGDIIVITGKTPHVIMFLSWAPGGQIQCIHETGSANNVTVSVMTANWPYYRNLLD